MSEASVSRTNSTLHPTAQLCPTESAIENEEENPPLPNENRWREDSKKMPPKVNTGEKGDGDQGPTAPTASVNTVQPQVGNVVEIVQRKHIPHFSGEKNTISLDHWVLAVTNSLEAKSIKEPSAQVAEALNYIDYSKGSAAEIVNYTNFKDLGSLFDSLRVWCTTKKSNLHANFESLFGINFNPNKESFLTFTRKLLSGYDKLVEMGYNQEEHTKIFLNFIESRIVMSLPERIRDKFIGTEFQITSRDGLEKFFQSCYIELSKIEKRPVHHIKTQFKNKSNGKPDKSEKGEDRKLPWEKRTGRCARCGSKGHYKAICKNEEKCTLCRTDGHQFINCPDNIRNKKPMTTEGEESVEEQQPSTSFLGARPKRSS